jgi:hypothetical protein
MVALVDDDDFEDVSRFKWHARTCRGRAYAARGVYENGRTRELLLHRYLLNAPPGVLVDHRNGNGLDCRRSVNLRTTDATGNSANRVKTPGKSSRFKGVYLRRDANRQKPWHASLTIRDKRIYLGHFACEEDAARAYDAAAKRTFGEFALTNFSEEDV